MTDGIGAAVLSGVAASPGLAVGPIALQQGQRIERRKVGRPDEERNVLSAALAAAAMQLTALGEAAHDDVAAEILEFQLALLDDEELIGPIVEAVSAGQPAHQAWAAAIDREIAEYEAADDEVFRARGTDLADLRDRVLRAMAPAVVSTESVAQECEI